MFATFLITHFLAAIVAGQSYGVTSIDAELLKNANSVIRNHQRVINVIGTRKMNFSDDYTYTLLNDKAGSSIPLSYPHDKSTKIKSLEVKICNANGLQIELIKKKDFHDYAASGEGTLYSDNRVLYYDYTPKEWPITVQTSVTYESSNTGFIWGWNPVSSFNTSLEYSSFKIIFPKTLRPRVLESNFEQYPNIITNKSESAISYTLKNVPAIKHETMAPDFHKLAPKVDFALSNFFLEGVDGYASNWDELGSWFYEKLIKSQANLDPSIVHEMNTLTQGLETDKEKAKRIYAYVQERSRYISVQLGIGGWKPIASQEVHDMGYGDCKGLTNYTMDLMNAAGIKAHYAIIAAGDGEEEFDEDFARIQGNHVILCLPDVSKPDTIWLECTSRESPFGHIARSIDNRKTLVVSKEGGKLTKTQNFDLDQNVITTNTNLVVNKSGLVQIQFKNESIGQTYGSNGWLQGKNDSEIRTFYKEQLSDIPNIEILEASYNIDKEKVLFTEHVKLESSGLINPEKDEVLLCPNLISAVKSTPRRIRNRKLPFQIRRNITYKDSIEVQIPTGWLIKSIPENLSIESDFSQYSYEAKKTDGNKVLVTRRLIRKQGIFPAESYQDYVDFFRKIKKQDSSKILLSKKT